MKIIRGFLTLLLVIVLVSCQNTKTNKVSINGWDIAVDVANEKISISSGTLGQVLDSGFLSYLNEGAVTKLSGWKVKRDKEGFIIRTNDPLASSWKLKILENRITVESSLQGSSVTGTIPVSVNRFPARVADSSRILVSTTNKRSDYTGVTQFEKYYIPDKNPHVMYLSLGGIESPDLFCLFDKPGNTVIQFPPAARLTRIPDDQTLMKVSVPVDAVIDLIILIPDYYTKVLGMPNYVPYDDSYHTTAPTGWNHWLAFFRQVTEKDIVDHADFISENLKKFGMEHCQLDDGYDHVDRRLWVKNWDPVTFPNGPEWLAKYIKSRGLIPGLWTVPYCYSVNDINPDWFIRDDEGKILMDYQGGGELDFTREEVIQEYWIPLWKEFKRQGWEYHKFDMGNTSYMWHTYQDNFHDTTISSYDAAVRTMKIWREIMGPEVWHTNHPDVDGGRMGFIDVAGCGRDPGVGWEKMNNMLEVISNNSYQNHIIWYSDPDCIVLRGKPTRADVNRRDFKKIPFLTFEEAKTCASLLGLSGMQYLSGDDLLNLEEERMELIRKTIPVLPIFPVDLFGRGRDRKLYPEIVDLKINQPAGVYDVMAVTNWKIEPANQLISIEKELSLAGGEYIVFDFWQEKMAGLFTEPFTIDLPAHGTRVFFVHKKSGNPQLIGNNRHISGSFGIKKNIWDASLTTLSGVSESVPGVKYSLYFYIPQDFSLEKVDSNAQDVTYNLQNNEMLQVSFTGMEEQVSWSLKFKKK